MNKQKSIILTVVLMLPILFSSFTSFAEDDFYFTDIKMMKKEKGKEVYHEIKEVKVGELFCLMLPYPKTFTKDEVESNIEIVLRNEWKQVYKTSDINITKLLFIQQEQEVRSSLYVLGINNSP